jgi:hypothetical protein
VVVVVVAVRARIAAAVVHCSLKMCRNSLDLLNKLQALLLLHSPTH